MQNLIGTGRFQSIFTEFHHLEHDKIELQYLLHPFRQRSDLATHGFMIPPKLFSTFNNQNQYADYVLSADYIGTIYTTAIDKLQKKMYKHTMLFDDKALKGDHSFKFAKQMAKIEQTSIFTALYTITNEYEEIVHQVNVPSTSLDYVKFSLEKMKEAYEDYGHDMPIVFFTDNVKQCAFLIYSFDWGGGSSRRSSKKNEANVQT